MESRYSISRSVDVVVTAIVLACVLCFTACYANGAERPREVINLGRSCCDTGSRDVDH